MLYHIIRYAQFIRGLPHGGIDLKKGFVKVISALLLILMLIGCAETLALASEYGALDSAYAAATVPSRYNYNPSNLPNYITSVKNQEEMGLCWAYAAASCAEADAIKNESGVPTDLDLSEWHLAYFTYHGTREGTGDSVSLGGTTPYYDLGGYSDVIAMVLSNKIGFVTEDRAPMETLKKNTSAKLNKALMYECDYQLENAYCYNPKTEKEALKEAIMEHGSALVNYYSGESYYNSNYAAQYCGDSSKVSDHAVTIVGWDDSFSKTKFKYGSRPSSNGAWLVKNSWGESFGQNGYFWLSYEDATICDAVVFDVAVADEKETLYSHDGGMSLTFVNLGSNDSIANLFIVHAATPEKITAVGFDVREASGANKDYQIDIYVNPRFESSKDYQYQVKSLPVYSCVGEFHNGYNKIILDKSVDIDGNDLVMISITTQAQFLVDMNWTDQDNIITSSAGVSALQTIAYDDADGYWMDAYGTPSADKRFNARIKMYTEASTKLEPILTNSPSIYIDYGTRLYSGELSSLVEAEVVDPDNYGIPVSGNWIAGSGFEDGKIYNYGDTVELTFIPDDSDSYSSISVPVTVYTRAVPLDVGFDVSTTSPDGEFHVGDEVTVRIVLPDGISLNSLKGNYEFYCRYGGEEHMYSDDLFGFYLPEYAEGQDMEIEFRYYGDDHQFQSATYRESFYVYEAREAETVPPFDNGGYYPDYGNDNWDVVVDNNNSSHNNIDFDGIADGVAAVIAIIAVVVVVVVVIVGAVLVIAVGVGVVVGGVAGAVFGIKAIAKSARENKNYWK